MAQPKLVIDEILGIDENGENVGENTNEEPADKKETVNLEDIMAAPEEAKTEEPAAEETEAATEKPEEKAEEAEPEAQPDEEKVEEEIEEAAVPASAGEEAREQRGGDEAPRQAARQRQPRTGTARIRQIAEVGNKSDEILDQEAKEKSDKEKENETFRKLNSLQRTKDIGWGEIYAIEPADEINGLRARFIIAVMYNGAKVMIPETEYFEDTFNFGANYGEMSSAEKANRRAAMARTQIGARIPFVVYAVMRKEIESGVHEGDSTIIAVGSRKEAMRTLRDVFFIHKNHPAIPSRDVQPGYQAWANVIGVREEYAIVECLGVETRIDAYNLNDEYVENCNDFVRAGDKMRVRIRRFHVDDDNVFLTVSGRLNDTSKAIAEMKQRGNYLGVVDHFNKNNGYYTVTLKNGVRASVRAENVNGEIELTNGDNVSVLVTGIMDEYVIGLAKKI